MALTKYVSACSDAREERVKFDALVNSEFYRGNSKFEVSRGFAIRIDEGLADPVRVLSLRLFQLNSVFQRSSRDIGDADMDVVWFVARGRLSLMQDGYSGTATGGQFIFNHSRSPFSMQQCCDSFGLFEAKAVLVPGRLLRQIAAHGAKPATSFPIVGANGRFAESSFQSLLEFGRELSPAIAHPAALASLRAIERARFESGARPEAKINPSHSRWRQVESYISARYWDPDLSVAAVARHCKISLRRLCRVAEERGTTVSDLLWKTRVERARDWLSAPAGERRSMAEIAASTGFKTLAHFSRRFKQAYGVSPRLYESIKN